MNKLLIIFGTRPELIKLSPIIKEFEKRGLADQVYIVNTCQHNELIKDDLHYFNITPHYHFSFTRDNDSLHTLTGNLMLEFDKLKVHLLAQKIQLTGVIAQGDTSTTFCSALFAFYESKPFIHIEAGLRTFDNNEPFPEEFYRTTISRVSDLHFVPTITSFNNLVSEEILKEKIYITGNTIIDHLTTLQISQEKKDLVLITLHRRENRGLRLIEKINYVKQLAEKNPDKQFKWLLHPGITIPSEDLGSNIVVSSHVSYREMLELYKKACMILSDSGGIQEEAGYLGIPMIVMRKKTERVEGIQTNIAYYMDEIPANTPVDNYSSTSPGNHLYGDGKASERIVDILIEKYKL